MPNIPQKPTDRRGLRVVITVFGRRRYCVFWCSETEQWKGNSGDGEIKTPHGKVIHYAGWEGVLALKTLDVQFTVKRRKKKHQKSSSFFLPLLSRRLDLNANFHQVSANWGRRFGKFPREPNNRHASSRFVRIIEVSTLDVMLLQLSHEGNKMTRLVSFLPPCFCSSTSMWGFPLSEGWPEYNLTITNPQH